MINHTSLPITISHFLTQATQIPQKLVRKYVPDEFLLDTPFLSNSIELARSTGNQLANHLYDKTLPPALTGQIHSASLPSISSLQDVLIAGAALFVTAGLAYGIAEHFKRTSFSQENLDLPNLELALSNQETQLKAEQLVINGYQNKYIKFFFQKEAPELFKHDTTQETAPTIDIKDINLLESLINIKKIPINYLAMLSDIESKNPEDKTKALVFLNTAIELGLIKAKSVKIHKELSPAIKKIVKEHRLDTSHAKKPRYYFLAKNIGY